MKTISYERKNYYRYEKRYRSDNQLNGRFKSAILER